MKTEPGIIDRALLDAANSPPTPEPVYHYYDETRTGPSILAELGLRTVDTPSP